MVPLDHVDEVIDDECNILAGVAQLRNAVERFEAVCCKTRQVSRMLQSIQRISTPVIQIRINSLYKEKASVFWNV